MKYIVKNNNTGKSYEVKSDFNSSLDMVWLSQKDWFMPGCSVTVTDENGNSKTFTK